MNEGNYKYSGLTEKIIQCFYTVYNRLGYGFLEKVYENALIIELRKQGLECRQQKKINVYYDEFVVGDYFTDILVEDKIMLELKAHEVLNPADGKQLVNYLRATTIEVGLLLNFGKKPQFQRKVFDNEYKNFS